MRIVRSILLRHCICTRLRYSGLLILTFTCIAAGADDRDYLQETPLEQAGLKPVFRENFTDGKLDIMRYTPAYGSREQFYAYIQPGAIFLGQQNATENTEQQINYFPRPDDLAIRTIEFDVWTTALRESRILVRPNRYRDGVHMRIGQAGERTQTQVVFRNEPGGHRSVDYKTLTGPSQGWAHVVVSYRVEMDEKRCEFVVAVNGQVHGRPGISQDRRPDDITQPFGIEYNGAGPEKRYYIANVRGYTEFLVTKYMKRALGRRVKSYLAKLEPPSRVRGERPQLVQVDRALINVTRKPRDFDKHVLKEVPKAVVKVMRGPIVQEGVWVTHETDVAGRNLVVKFGSGYRVVQVVYDSRGTGPAKGLFRSGFKLALGYGGWGNQKSWNPIAIQGGLPEGGIFTLYPNVPARYLKIYDTITVSAGGERVEDTWFVNVNGLYIYTASDPNLKRRGANAYGEQTDEQGQFVGTADLLD